MPDKHRRRQRRSIRLPGYDYASPGAYFVTICVRQGECLLGDVVNAEMQWNEFGRLAHDFWARVPVHFPNVSIDSFVIMPNHLHAIIIIHEKGEGTSPLQDTQDVDGDRGGAVAAPGSAVVLMVMGEKGEGTSPLQGPQDDDGDRRGAVAAPIGVVAPAAVTSTPPQSRIEKPTLGQIIAYYKHQTTKQINQARDSTGLPFWQRNYWEHIIRNEGSLNRIREYIDTNPARWAEDQLHPDASPNRFNQWTP